MNSRLDVAEIPAELARAALRPGAPAADIGSWDFASGYLKLPNKVSDVLCKRPRWLAVYVKLATRARYTTSAPSVTFTPRGYVALDIGQCIYGRTELAKECGQTEDQIRTAIRHLRNLGLITTETPNGNPSLGTIATICKYKETYGLADPESPAESPTNAPAHPQRDAQETPANKTEKKKKTGKTGRQEDISPEAFRLSLLLLNRIAERQPSTTIANLTPEALDRESKLERNAGEIDRLHRLDKVEWAAIGDVIEWCTASSFWQPHILSGKKLRSKWNTLASQRANDRDRGRAGPRSGALGRYEPRPFADLPETGDIPL